MFLYKVKRSTHELALGLSGRGAPRLELEFSSFVVPTDGIKPSSTPYQGVVLSLNEAGKLLR